MEMEVFWGQLQNAEECAVPPNPGAPLQKAFITIAHFGINEWKEPFSFFQQW